METHVDQQRRIEALFRGRLASSEHTELQLHLSDCSDCRRSFERYAQAESALSPKSPLSPLARDRVADRLFGPSAPAPAPVRWPAFLLAAMAASAVFFVVPRLRNGDELQPRGDGPVAPVKTEVSLRALAITLGADARPAVIDLSSSEAPVARSAALRILGTSYGQPRHARVFVRAADGREHTVVADLAVPANAEDHTLVALDEIPASWPAGPLSIAVVFAPVGTALPEAAEGAGKEHELRRIEARLDGAAQ